jgi:pyruvate dehydrogenase E1 component beta subunit
MHIPGLLVVTPSTPDDGKGLMTTAILDENPVVFIGHRKLLAVKGDVPEDYYTIPFGKAEVKRQGRDITIVATQAMVPILKSQEFSKDGIEIEVLDLRTLKPMDKEAILESVKKTGRLIVADEGHSICGVVSEISAMVSEEAMEYLQAPILRVGSPDTPVPFSPPLEKIHVPDEDNLREAVDKLKKYI